MDNMFYICISAIVIFIGSMILAYCIDEFIQYVARKEALDSDKK